MRKKAMALAMAVSTSVFVLAQQADVRLLDSVRSVAFVQKPDTSSIAAFVELQRYFFNRAQYDSALYYSNLSIPIAEKAGSGKQHARILYNAGLIYTNLTRYDSAIYFLNAAEKKALEINDENLLVNVLNANALLSNYQSDYKTAIAFLTKAAELAEANKSPELKNWLPQLYGNIGHNLIAEKQLEKGIAYEKKALQYSGYPDEKRYKVMLYLDIADAYLRLEKPSVAQPFIDSAAHIAAGLNNTVLQTLLFNTRGAYFAASNNNVASLQSYLRAYTIADSTNNIYVKADCASHVAKAYLKTGNLFLSEKYAGIANEIAAKLSAHNIRTSAYETLKEIARLKGDFKKAFQMSEWQKVYADSASNDASKKSSLYLEARYQNVIKENEIATLNISNKTKELKVFQRNKMLLTGGIVSAALLLLMGLLYRQSRQKRLLAEKDAALKQEQVKFLERQQQVVSLQSMVNGQETERTRIAKDLHDGLGGLFSTTKMYFSTLQHEQPALKEDPLFIKSYEMVNTASEEVRRIAHNMMPEVLIKIGLLQAVQELCNSISAGKLLTVTLQSYGMGQRLNSSTEIMLFRIIQELLNNIIKHAKASNALIQFNRQGNRLSIIVEDNGRGFNTDATEQKSKAGLASVESRVSYLNGKLSIDSQMENGTTVMMEFLLNEE